LFRCSCSISEFVSGTETDEVLGFFSGEGGGLDAECGADFIAEPPFQQLDSLRRRYDFTRSRGILGAVETTATGQRSSFAFYSGAIKIFLEWGILGGILIFATKLSFPIPRLDCARSVATLSATSFRVFSGA
jgi:hypothetical protein